MPIVAFAIILVSYMFNLFKGKAKRFYRNHKKSFGYYTLAIRELEKST
jgi:hypothetical protein